MMHKSKFIFFITIAFLSCNPLGKNNQEIHTSMDAFYTDRGGGGTYLRIPLIKPYEAIKVSDNEWRIELQTTFLLELSIHNVQALNVIKNVIFIYAKGKEVSIRGVQYKEAWFVIIPHKQFEGGFDKREDFVKYLSSINLQEPNLYKVEEIYSKFNHNKKIDWQSDFK
jgi:hypothetical protein